jgi:hypothetical protein
MDKILALLRDPVFWFSVIVVGILINMLAAYLKQYSDNLWARYSDRKNQQLDKKHKERLERMHEMAANHEELIHAYYLERRERFHALYYFMFAAVFFVVKLGTDVPPPTVFGSYGPTITAIAETILSLAGVTAFLISTKYWNQARDASVDIMIARRSRRQAIKEGIIIQS